MRTLTFDFEFGETHDLDTINRELAGLRLMSLEVKDIKPYLTVAIENEAQGAYSPRSFYRLGITHLELAIEEGTGKDSGIWQMDAKAYRRGTVDGGEAYIDTWALEHPDLAPEFMMQFEFQGDDVDCFVVFATLASWAAGPEDS